MTANDSGCYQLEDGVISYRSEVYGSWQLPVSEVSAIGEYTNEDGPFADDYFLVFITHNDSGWFEGSFYGEGRDKLVRGLSTLLCTEISLGLSHSTTFTSRILWPEMMRGEPLFDFKPQGIFKNRQVLAMPGANKTNSEQDGGGQPATPPRVEMTLLPTTPLPVATWRSRGQSDRPRVLRRSGSGRGRSTGLRRRAKPR